MNIGMIKKNASGQLVGQVSTLAVSMTIGLRAVTSTNPAAPKFDVLALNAARNWISVGALFELTATKTGEAFYQGKIDDPTMDAPLYIACFRQDDGSYAVAWRRNNGRRRDALDTVDDDGYTGGDGAAERPAGDGLGESTAPPRGGKARTKDPVSNEPPLIPAE
jgi:uncharacterized protein (DUF736 family)